MRIVKLTKETTENILENMLKRSPTQYGTYEASVQEIIENVKTRKDAAVFEYTEKFDHAVLDASTVEVTQEEIDEAYNIVDPELIGVIRRSMKNIREFHEKQKQNSWVHLYRERNDAWPEADCPEPCRRYTFREERQRIRPLF